MIRAFDHSRWAVPAPPDVARQATAAIESGDVLLFPSLAFELAGDEQRLFSIDTARSVKNVSYTPWTGRVAGVQASVAEMTALHGALARFSESAVALARAIFPSYASALEIARASFRPAEIAGRKTSWRKDDTRLHVDSFPSSPTAGRRILRVFTNVNPHGHPRRWRIGGAFANLVTRYDGRLRMPWPGVALLLHALHVTKSPRTPYDALMLQLHDLMKQDPDYQRTTDQTSIDFAPGATWVAFTDEVSHAAMTGRYQFEQTLLLPVDAMENAERAPLRILERAMGRPLVTPRSSAEAAVRR